MNKKDNFNDIPKCYREFYLSYTNNYEDAGFNRDYIEWLLDLLKDHPDDEALTDADVQNNIGTIFEDGIMVKKASTRLFTGMSEPLTKTTTSP